MSLSIFYIPDSNYDAPNKKSDFSKKNLEKKFGQSLSETNIGSGADWPAFVLALDENKEVLTIIGLFFLGEKIEKNFDAWVSIGKRITNLAKSGYFWFNRTSAFLYGLSKVYEKITDDVRSIKLIKYQWYDSRVTEDWRKLQFEGNIKIEPPPKTEYAGGAIHHFLISINNKEIEFLVKSTEVEIKNDK